MLNSISLYFVQDKCYFFPSTETSQVAEKQWIKIKMESNDWEHRNSVICFKPIHVNRKNIEHIFCIIFHKKRDRLASWKCFFFTFSIRNSHEFSRFVKRDTDNLSPSNFRLRQNMGHSSQYFASEFDIFQDLSSFFWQFQKETLT